MTRLATIVLIPILVQVLGASSAFANRPILKFLSGKVVKSGQDSITVSDGKTSLTAEVDGETKVTVNGERAPFKDISVGATATVLVNVETGLVIRVSANSDAAILGRHSAEEPAPKDMPSDPEFDNVTVITLDASTSGQKDRRLSVADPGKSPMATTYDNVRKWTRHDTQEVLVDFDNRTFTTTSMQVGARIPDDQSKAPHFVVTLASHSVKCFQFEKSRELRVSLKESRKRLTIRATDYVHVEKIELFRVFDETVTFSLQPGEFKSVFSSEPASFHIGNLAFVPSKREMALFASVYDEMMKTLGAQALAADVDPSKDNGDQTKPSAKMK